MAKVKTIQLVAVQHTTKGNIVETNPAKPTASFGDTVRWECSAGDFWVVFKKAKGTPLNKNGLNGPQNGGKGSKVKIKVKKGDPPDKYKYAAAIFDPSAGPNGTFYTADPPLDIVPGA